MSNTQPPPPSPDARARVARSGVYTGRTPAEVDAHVNAIMDLMVSGEWNTKRAKQYADEHGISVSTVGTWAAQASRILRSGSREERHEQYTAAVCMVEDLIAQAKLAGDFKGWAAGLTLLLKIKAFEGATRVDVTHANADPVAALLEWIRAEPNSDARDTCVYRLLGLALTEAEAMAESRQRDIEALVRHYLQTRELPALVAGEEEEDGTE